MVARDSAAVPEYSHTVGPFSLLLWLGPEATGDLYGDLEALGQMLKD